MPKFLFWNLGGRTIVPLVRLAAAINRVDILILAEVSLPPASVEEQLNIDSAEFRYAGGNYQRVHFYCRFDNRFLTLLSETDKYSIRRLRLPARKELLLVGAHLPSLMAVSAAHIAEECRFLSAEIQRIESVENHRRTVLMGDLNLNPFDSVLVQTTGLHAVASRITALRNTRTVQNRSFPFFIILCGDILAIGIATLPGRFIMEVLSIWHTSGILLTKSFCGQSWLRISRMIKSRS